LDNFTETLATMDPMVKWHKKRIRYV